MLTTKSLEALGPEDVGRKLTDKDGVFGTVRGRKDGKLSVLFRWRFRFGGKHHDFNCGTWPGDSLQQIRKRRRLGYEDLQQDKNPNVERKLQKLRAIEIQSQEQQDYRSSGELAVRVLAQGREICSGINRNFRAGLGKCSRTDRLKAALTNFLVANVHWLRSVAKNV